MTRARSLTDLRQDNKGAVMMTGLFMSTFLVGSLWVVIGIGDALVFRDKMQEAADVAAFSSAALHAKGMNFISLCNLILLVGVTIHIILGIVHDILFIVCITTLFGCIAYAKAFKIYRGYFKALKIGAKAIHVGQVVAAYGYPIAGFVEGMQNGGSYARAGERVTVLPLSQSLIPGGGKDGLPVTAKPYKYLCEKIVKVGITAIFNRAVGIAPGSPSGKAIDKVKGIVAQATVLLYCNGGGFGAGAVAELGRNDQIDQANGEVDKRNAEIDKQNAGRKEGDPLKERLEKIETGSGSGLGALDPRFDGFWNDEGPYVVYPKGKNGERPFQTYAMNIAPKFQDTSDSRVAYGQGPKPAFSKYTKTDSPIGYFAQAEFYYDCNNVWGDLACNYEDNATFQIKWLARMRKLDVPKVIESGVQVFATLEALQNGIQRAREIFNAGVASRENLNVFIDALKRGDPTKGLGVVDGIYH